MLTNLSLGYGSNIQEIRKTKNLYFYLKVLKVQPKFRKFTQVLLHIKELILNFSLFPIISTQIIKSAFQFRPKHDVTSISGNAALIVSQSSSMVFTLLVYT